MLGQSPTPQPRGYAREEGNAHKHRHPWPRPPSWCCAENNSVFKDRCGRCLVVTALPRAWEHRSWIYQGLPVYNSLNKLWSSAKGGPRGSSANLCHCSAMCPVVFPVWWWENSPGWSGVQKWILPSRGESCTSSFQLLMSIIMSWFSQEAPSLLLVMLQQKKAMCPTWPSREHFIFKPLGFGTVSNSGGDGLGNLFLCIFPCLFFLMVFSFASGSCDCILTTAIYNCWRYFSVLKSMYLQMMIFFWL